MDFLMWASENEELTIVSLVAICVATVFTLSIIASTIRRIWIGQQQLALKQAMVEQGMSVDEIERVLKG